MPFCPDCMTAYNETQLKCTTCKVDLLPDLAPTHGHDWYTVCSVPNEVAGYILRSVLEDEGIPVYLQSYGMSVYGGIKGHPGKSEWGDILVPTHSVKRAQDCIKAYYDSLKEG